MDFLNEQAGGMNSKAQIKSNGSKPARANEIMIPKRRFDCVSLRLKNLKKALAERTAENESLKDRAGKLENDLLNALVEKCLAGHRAKSIPAAKALIDFSKLKPEQDGNVPGLEEQISAIKNSRDYLFENQKETAYMLVPLDLKEIKKFILKGERSIV